MPDAYEDAHPPLDKNNSADAAFDLDMDTLSNLQEFAAGTNPQVGDSDGDGLNDNSDPWPTNTAYNIDSDNDGLPDAWELAHGLDPYNANDANDPEFGDWDLLTPLQEFALGTDPQSGDTDGDGGISDDRHDVDPTHAHGFDMDLDADFDGMPAWWENLPWNGCCTDDSFAFDGFDDMDGDGVNNLQEYRNGTWPDIAQDRDDDNDGMPNGWEAAHGLQPTDPYNGSYDQDADGLSNLDEFKAGTDPMLADSDRDGVNDGDDHWPMDAQYALDSDDDGLPDAYEDAHPPLDKNNSADAAFDLDMDTLSNLQEFAAGTNPQVGDSDGDGLNDNSDPWPTNTAYNIDSDNDGLPDAWELAHGLDPYNANDANDPEFGDWDLLTPLQEFALGTDPQSGDTDGDGGISDDRHDVDPTHAHGFDMDLDADFDGMPAWWENLPWNGCCTDDSFAFDGFDDMDGDGVNNLQEFTWGTDPSLEDSDGDGLSDGHEFFVLHTNPAAADTDGDGVNDAIDKFPLDASDWADNDLDGIGNNADPDDDNDGWNDVVDAFPLDPSQHDANTVYPLSGMFRGSSIHEHGFVQ